MNSAFRYFTVVFFLLMACNNRLGAQTPIWNTAGAYLGQEPPGDIPQVFAASLLKDSGIVLGRVAFSRDGRSFYYGYAKHWFDGRGTGIKQIHFDGKQWSRPEIIVENFSTPTLSIDESRLFLGGQNSDVWISDRSSTGWGQPKLFLDLALHGIYNFMPTASGRYYAGGNADTGKKYDYSAYDFCTVTIRGADTLVQSLGAPLNTPGFDGDFYIAPDESYMIVSAKETNTYECELWISFRKKNGQWGEPKSLGDAINKGLAHRFGQYVSPDGKYLFYTQGTGEADCNFYWVRFDKLLQKLAGN